MGKRKLFSLFIVILYCVKVSAQEERVYLDLNTYTCDQGDTVFFKAYITSQGAALSHLSTNLYVNVYTEKGHLLSRETFPIYHGLSQGQVIFKDQVPTDNYYIVAYTKEQLNYTPIQVFSVPVVVYNKEMPAVIHHKKAVKDQNIVATTTVKNITWMTHLSKGNLSSLVEIDSPVLSRHFLLQMPVKTDSGLVANMTLNSRRTQKCGLFPIDSTKEVQTLLLYEDSILIARQALHLNNFPEEAVVTPDTLDLSPGGYNSWQIQMPDSLLSYHTSISIEDADRSIPSPASITTLHDPYSEDLTAPAKMIDTSYIRFTGKATRESGKTISDYFSREIFLAGMKDSSYLFTKIFSIDEKGNFLLDSLLFFDTVGLQFQINKQNDGRTKDLALKLGLNLNEPTLPVVDSALLFSSWEDDSTMIDQRDTAFTKKELSDYDLSKMKMLRPAIVKKWKDRRKELDHAYATGPFSEPALYSYDLRNYTGEYNRNIFWYLSAQGGRLRSNAAGNSLADVSGHPIHYFVDEVEYDCDNLKIIDFDRIAYIKVLESDVLSTRRASFSLVPAGTSGLSIPVWQTPVNVLIYTRKGADFRTMRGGMNKMYVKGYDRILPFSSGKRAVFWSPGKWGTRLGYISLTTKFATNSE